VFLAEFCLFFNTGPSNTALANVAHPAIRATAFAVNIFFIHALGDAISPPIIGRLSDMTGRNMNVGFGAVGAMMIAGAIFWFWGSRYLDHDTENASHQLERPQDVPLNKPIPPTAAGPQG
jgi:MFS family permease